MRTPVFSTGRDIHFDGLFHADRTGAAAFGAFIPDDLAAALTVLAGDDIHHLVRKGPFLTTRCCPVPWQSGQVSMEEPGSAPVPWQWVQVSFFGTVNFFLMPVAASRRVISIS